MANQDPATVAEDPVITLKASEIAEIVVKQVKEAIQRQTIPPIIGPNSGAKTGAKRYSALKHFKGEGAEEKAKRFGYWMLASITGSQQAQKFCEANGLAITKTHKEGANETGGFLVPEEFLNDLIDLREKYGVFRRNAKIQPMTSDTASVPVRKGGVTAYFKGESAAMTESTKAWGQVKLVAEKITALVRYSTELDEDAVINIGDDLAGEIAYAFALKEDQCGFNGDGTSTYGGIVGVIPKLLAVDGTIANVKGLVVASGNLLSEITLADFNNVVATLPEYAETGNVKWYCSKKVWAGTMQRLITAAGGVTAAELVGGVTKKMFLGYEVEIVQVMPKTDANSQIVALFGDFSLGALFGDRRQVTITSSTEADGAFENDEVLIKGTQRFDIKVHGVGDTTDAGPIVGLITAAS